jgi:hypothetical protein
MDACLIPEVRTSWDVQLQQYTVHFSEDKKLADGADYFYRRLSFTFPSPAPILVSDRELYLVEMVRKDWPVPGAICYYAESLPDDAEEYPLQDGKVRAKFFLMTILYPKEVKEGATGIESLGEVEYITINSTDPGGWLPPTVVNMVS